jgi:hypothetical protein
LMVISCMLMSLHLRSTLSWLTAYIHEESILGNGLEIVQALAF